MAQFRVGDRVVHNDGIPHFFRVDKVTSDGGWVLQEVASRITYTRTSFTLFPAWDEVTGTRTVGSDYPLELFQEEHEYATRSHQATFVGPFLRLVGDDEEEGGAAQEEEEAEEAEEEPMEVDEEGA